MVRRGTLVLAMGMSLVLTQEAGAQVPGGMRGRRGGVRAEVGEQIQALRAFPLEAMWAALCLGIDGTQSLTDAQVALLRPAMQDAWEQRREILAFARENDAWDVAAGKLQDLRKRTEERLKAALTEEQWKSWRKLVDEAAGGLARRVGR